MDVLNFGLDMPGKISDGWRPGGFHNQVITVFGECDCNLGIALFLVCPDCGQGSFDLADFAVDAGHQSNGPFVASRAVLAFQGNLGPIS